MGDLPLRGATTARWANSTPPDRSVLSEFMAALKEVFHSCQSHVVEFYNPLQDKTSASTVYVAAH